MEAKSAAGVGPASRSMALTAFAASKPSVPQEFDVDLQSLSKGWVVFLYPKNSNPGATDLLIVFLVWKLAFIQIVGPPGWLYFLLGKLVFYRSSTQIFVEAKLDGVGSWGVGSWGVGKG